MEKCGEWGARIERGKILASEDGKYTIESYDRDGLSVTGLPAVGNESYAVGDRVYFFLFSDGTGAVIGAF